MPSSRFAAALLVGLGAVVSVQAAQALEAVYTGTIDEITSLEVPGEFNPEPVFSLGDEWRFTLGPGFTIEVGDLTARVFAGVITGPTFVAYESLGVRDSDPLLLGSFALEHAQLSFFGFLVPPSDLNLVPPDPADFERSSLGLTFIDTVDGSRGFAVSHSVRRLPEPRASVLTGMVLAALLAGWAVGQGAKRGLRVAVLAVLAAAPFSASAGFCPVPVIPPVAGTVQQSCGSIPGCYTMAIVADTQLLVDGCPKLAANGVCEFLTPGSTDPNTFANPLDQQDYAKFGTLVSWLLANRGPAEENIQFVVHVGDIIDTSRNVPIPDFCGNVCTTTTQNIFIPSGCQGFQNPIACCMGPQQSNCPGDSCQCRQLPQSLIEWQRFDAQWKRLDQASLPYAIVLGNHDSPGILPASYCPTDATTYAGRDLVGSGFFNVFPPARLAQLPGYVGTHVQCSANNGFLQVKSRRGPSHAWRFNLGPYPIGVLGVTEGFARTFPAGADPAPAAQDVAWAQGLIDGAFAGIPVVVAAHQHFDFPPGTPSGTPLPHWLSVVAPNFPEVSVAPMGHVATEFGLRERDSANPNPATRVLFTRSDGYGYRTAASANPGPAFFEKPSVILVRFLLKSVGGTERDEVDILTIVSPDNLADRSLWTRQFCQEFSIFYDDIDRDGRKSTDNPPDNCPLIYNPSQNADACDCDLNGNHKLDGGDALLALRFATGDPPSGISPSKADLAPHPAGDTDVDMGDVNRMLRAIQGEFAQGCVP